MHHCRDVGADRKLSRGPEQSGVRTHINADSARHAGTPVDGEGIEHVDGSGPSAASNLNDLLMRHQRDRPVGALSDADHA